MKLSSTLPVMTLAFALAAPIALMARNDDAGKLPNGPTADEATTAKLVYGLLSDSRYAYRPRALDDALSQDIFKRYLEALDPGKLFFTAEDVKNFQPYATKLDDAIKSGEMDAPYAMFALYKQRVNERVAMARATLKNDKFDFSGHESYQYDREKAPWATAAQLDSLWTQSVRNDWLRLKLAGKKPDEIRKTLDKRYANLTKGVDDLNGEDVFQTFLNSYAGSIDPHTDYFTPRTAANFNLSMSLSLEGIGAVLQKQDEVVVIREIVPGGPAARSGKLKPGDRIVAVGQGTSGEMKDVVGWRIDDVVELIRGPKNTPVRLDVVPAEAGVDAKPSRLVLTRDKVRLEEQAAKAQTITVPGTDGTSKKIGVIKLPAFYQDFEGRRKNANDYASATRDVARLLAQLKVQKVDGVVLDLRNNGGGSLTEAVELTGLFIDQGPVVQVRESGGRVSVEDDDQSGVAWDGPFAVLINRGSASASEIFAGAIQDYGRGLVIGETTFGKGTVQNLIDLDRWPANEESRFGQVKLTIAQFFRVSGGSTQHKGVVPDIRFPVTVDASEFGESTYDNALPWTRIAAVPHTQYGNFAPLLPRLDAMHAARVAKDKEFQWWSEDVAQFRQEQAKKSVSLNENDRRAERDTFEAKRKARQAERKALGLPLDPFAEEDNDDGLQASERNIAKDAAREKMEDQRPDPLLRESAAILSDALTLLNGDRQLSQQVLPASRTLGHWSE
ncbi:carboxy terminal-processing peptidase [Lysobacter sp. KIS68-7]|uniref:carboxy terminal-processing peptidase n=1 Tax=Lysobacter sp. KIS68-7 TaxID=2904252 RepID=UPI001E476D84|nr:carboxy terminal-processing peptidase [Lysobacter sp. KIS68-7]UHQ20243.1 carboxy terminal-processing peptidase [Lysobacter sp. KIS68-7]